MNLTLTVLRKFYNFYKDEMNNGKPTGRETQHNIEMEHKAPEDMTFFPFEKRVDGTTEIIGSKCIFEQMTKRSNFFKILASWYQCEM